MLYNRSVVYIVYLSIYCKTHLGQSSLGMVDEVRLECSGDRGMHVFAGGRVCGDDGRVGGSRLDAVDGDVTAVRIGYIIVNSGRNLESG